MAYLGDYHIDAKCGKSGIAKGKKCKKGNTAATPLQKGLLIGGAGVAGLGVGGQVANIVQGRSSRQWAKSTGAVGAGNALVGLSRYVQGRRTGNKEMEETGRNVAIGGGVTAGAGALLGSRRVNNQLGRASRSLKRTPVGKSMRRTGRKVFAKTMSTINKVRGVV